MSATVIRIEMAVFLPRVFVFRLQTEMQIYLAQRKKEKV